MSLTLATATATAAPAADTGAARMRDYRSVAISAGGERIAAIEASDPGVPGRRAHARIVVRDAAGGKVTAEYDPCATCSYDFPSWSPDRQALGFRSQGWLIGPRQVQAGRRHPMVVIVHGGPASAATPRFVAAGESGHPLVRELVERGYFVFQPNPRGSFGQGLAFTQANRRDFGGGDWRDVLAGIDAVVKEAPVDGARLGLMGHSYGGFMTM